MGFLSKVPDLFLAGKRLNEWNCESDKGVSGYTNGLWCSTVWVRVLFLLFNNCLTLD